MDEWTEVRLGDVCKVINGRAFSQKELQNSGKYPVLRVGNFFSRNKWYYSDLKLDENKYCECGDLLYAWSASFGPKIWDGQRVIYHYHIWKLNVSPRIDKYYLYYWLLTSSRSLTSGIHGSVMGHLTKSNMENQIILLPNIAIQRKIASVLSSLDDKIELNTHMNKVLEEIARALFHQWFVEFEFPNADGRPYKSAAGNMVESEIGYVPEGWEVGTIHDLGKLNPKSWSNKNNPDIVNYIDLSNVNCGEISNVVTYPFSEAPSRARRILEVGDTIIGTVRPGNRSFTLIQEGGLTGSTGFAVIHPFNQNTREFLYLGLTQNEVIDYLSHIADGGAYPAVSAKVIMDCEIVLPPDHLLSAFSLITSQLFREIAVNHSQNNILRRIRDGLLPKLIGGEIMCDC